jgi:hypothetical protein
MASDIVQRTVSTTQKNAIARSNLKSAVKPAAGDVEKEWTHDLHELDNPSTQSPRGRKPTRTAERLYASVNGSASSPSLSAQFNVLPPKSLKAISIKGLAGPYIVMAKNFAQGTTAEDIESAMTPVGGVCLSCRIVTERPTVIAEIIFESKDGADNVVSTFNNQNASTRMPENFKANFPRPMAIFFTSTTKSAPQRKHQLLSLLQPHRLAHAPTL